MTHLETMRVELSEWSSIDHGAEELCEAAQCDSPEQLVELLAPLIKVSPRFDGQLTLSATRKVGEVQVGGMLVSVLPAISTDALLELLGWMLGANLHLLNQSMGLDSFVSSGLTIQKALAAGLVLEMRGLVRGELHKDYVRRQERLMTLRGRPDFARQGVHPPAQGISCRYIELTRDTPPNRVLCAALKRASALLAGTRFEVEAVHQYQQVAHLVTERAPVTLVDVMHAREILGHRYQGYDASLLLSRLLLFGGGPVSVVGRGGMSGWWIDMPSLFERAVVEGVRRWTQHEGLFLRVQPRHQGAILDATREVYREARPDLMVYDASRKHVLAIADAKYKPYFRAEDTPERRPQRQVDREDLFQLAMYMGLAPEARTMIVSPVERDAPVIEARYTELFLNQRRLELVGVDLAALPRARMLPLW